MYHLFKVHLFQQEQYLYEKIYVLFLNWCTIIHILRYVLIKLICCENITEEHKMKYKIKLKYSIESKVKNKYIHILIR